MTIHPEIITSEQVRGARAILSITQAELAKKAKISKTALNNFERHIVTPRNETLVRIRMALEELGVEFMGQTGVNLAGDPFKAQILEGEDALKLLLDDIFETLVNTGKRLHISGVDESVYIQTGQAMFFEQIEKRLKHEIPTRLLIKQGDTNLVEPRAHYRWVPARVFNQMPYYVYGNKYAILLWGVPLRVVLIENESIANGYRKLFNENWRNGKELELPKDFKVHFHQYEPGFVGD